MRIVFWQNLLAFYQAAHIQALSDRGHSVTWVSEVEIDEDKRSQGWSVPTARNVAVSINPGEEEMDQLISLQNAQSFHIFSGLRGFPGIRQAFLKCAKTQARIGMLIENRDDQGLKGAVRFLTYRMEQLSLGKRIEFFLVMGYGGPHGGRRWYRKCGFRDDILFPYGYFVDGPAELSPIASDRERSFEIIFVGQLIKRKGIDLLLSALGTLPDLPWKLRIVGSGPEAEALKKLGESLGIDERIEYLPYQKNAGAMALIAQSDLFVLPSRFDGWGVVVNEALVRGVPVVCSDRCGAQDLLREDWRGGVFTAGSVRDLARLLKQWIGKGGKTPESSARIHQWARCISGASAAEYMCDILTYLDEKGNRPTAPWFKETHFAIPSASRSVS